jgi:hypothetical protein
VRQADPENHTALFGDCADLIAGCGTLLNEATTEGQQSLDILRFIVRTLAKWISGRAGAS